MYVYVHVCVFNFPFLLKAISSFSLYSFTSAFLSNIFIQCPRIFKKGRIQIKRSIFLMSFEVFTIFQKTWKKKLRTIDKYLRIISKNKCAIGFLTKMDSAPELISILWLSNIFFEKKAEWCLNLSYIYKNHSEKF